MASGKRVCVVGAGVSGLVATKECLSAGLSPTCFELKDGIGGLWNQCQSAKETTTPMVWDTLTTNTVKHGMAFSDFPFKPEETPFVLWKGVKAYLHRYAEHFGLNPYIRVNTAVVKICRTSDHETTGQWKVVTAPTTTKDQRLRKTEEHVFDLVVVCNGYFRQPKYTDIEGMDTFPGPTLHSYYYKNSQEFKGKTVMVVGNGFSGVDVSEDISHTADKVIWSVGKGCWIVPQAVSGGRPWSYCLSRSVLYAPNAEVLINDAFIKESEDKLDHTTSGLRPSTPPSVSALGLSNNLQMKIMTNKVQVYGQLESIKGSRAVFTDGSEVDGIDAIIYCTGFKQDLSFLEEEIIQSNGKMELYMMAFPVGRQQNTLAFVGQAGGDNSIFPFSELQSRLVAMIFTGQTKLPPQNKMRENANLINTLTRGKNGTYSYFLPIAFMWEMLAETAGVYPKFWRIFIRDPVLALRTWYGPLHTYHYRLLGPGNQWEKARQSCYDADEEFAHPMRHRPVMELERSDVTRYRKHQFARWFGGILPAATVVVGLCYVYYRQMDN